MEITETKTKFCKHCGEKIPKDAVICTKCGRQVEQISSSNPNIVINNTNTNTIIISPIISFEKVKPDPK